MHKKLQKNLESPVLILGKHCKNRSLHRLPQRVQIFLDLRKDIDEDLSTISRVAFPANEPCFLQAINDARYSSGRQPRHFSQFASRHLPAKHHEIEALQIRTVDPSPAAMAWLCGTLRPLISPSPCQRRRAIHW